MQTPTAEVHDFELHSIPCTAESWILAGIEGKGQMCCYCCLLGIILTDSQINLEQVSIQPNGAQRGALNQFTLPAMSDAHITDSGAWGGCEAEARGRVGGAVLHAVEHQAVGRGGRVPGAVRFDVGPHCGGHSQISPVPIAVPIVAKAVPVSAFAVPVAIGISVVAVLIAVPLQQQGAGRGRGSK